MTKAKKKKLVIKAMLLLITIVGILFIMSEKSEVQAAYFSSDINGIDESKYPGYKEKIKLLQQVYPNVQLLYTGLDWNTVIHNEHAGAHGRNLVDTSQGDDWICQTCKSQGVWYDSGKYCASEDAVRYVMDPRNFLNTTDVFQFQKLNTAVGTNPNEIRQVLQNQNVTYLKNDEAAVQAFATVANQKQLNAYHLITRVIQEQGRNGTSALSSGLRIYWQWLQLLWSRLLQFI